MDVNLLSSGKQLYSVGSVIVDRSLHTQTGNEAFFSYFGNDVTYSIRRTIDEQDFPRLEECINKVTAGVTFRTVIRMKGVNGELRWILASVRLISGRGESELYSIELSDVFSLEGMSQSSTSRLSEYRYILSLMSDLAFEYSSVQATVNGHIVSVKNPRSGFIKAGSIGEVILDENIKAPGNCEIQF